MHEITSISFLNETKKKQGVKETKAVKEDKLYILDEICVETTRNFVGALYLAKWLYPDLFEDLDPEEIHQEYFESWLGVSYKGIWAYPIAE